MYFRYSLIKIRIIFWVVIIVCIIGTEMKEQMSTYRDHVNSDLIAITTSLKLKECPWSHARLPALLWVLSEHLCDSLTFLWNAGLIVLILTRRKEGSLPQSIEAHCK